MNLAIPIQTERLLMRRFLPEDWRAVHSYLSNPQVTAWLPEGQFDPAQTQTFVTEHSGADAKAYAAILRSSGALIGHMIFHPWFAPRTYEIGWVFHPNHQRQGYATEAARALLRYSFDELQAHRVIATCQPENPASWRVMEKLGMRREGWFRQCIQRSPTLWWDEYFYALLASEWSEQTA